VRQKSFSPIEGDKYYAELPVGTRFWVPCSGIESLGFELGHVGRVEIYLGNKKFESGGWILRGQAEEEKIALAKRFTLCDNCKKIIDEITDKGKELGT